MTESPSRAAHSRAESASLAARLTTWFVIASLVLVLIAAFLLYGAVVEHLRGVETDLVLDRLHTLRVVLSEPADPAPNAEIIEEVEIEWRGGPRARVYARVIDSTGHVFTETRGMKECDVPESSFPSPIKIGAIRKHDAPLRETSGRVFALYSVLLDAGPESDKSVTVQAAIDATEHYALLDSYRRRMLVVLALTLVVATWVGYAIARRGLEPVERISENLRRIRSTTLNERLDPGGFPRELSSLATTCNEMLDGLEESFAKLVRFSADIAHELRTPINNLRGEVEVTLARPRSSDEYQTVLGSCLEEAQRLSKLIDSLLFLARAEGSAVQARKQPLDLGSEVAAVAEFYDALASEAGVDLSVDADAGLIAPVDRPLFQSAVGNLVENAIAATRRGGGVSIHAARDGDEIRIDVSDSGRGIPASDISRVFDRLHRVDSSRSAAGSSGGAGLGLAIVKSIVALHGGSVSLRSDQATGTTATLRFPARERPVAG